MGFSMPQTGNIVIIARYRPASNFDLKRPYTVRTIKHQINIDVPMWNVLIFLPLKWKIATYFANVISAGVIRVLHLIMDMMTLWNGNIFRTTGPLRGEFTGDEGNSPVPGEFPAQRPVTRSFDVFFDLRPNKRLSKQSRGWWFKTPSRPLWRHCNEMQSLLILLYTSCEWQILGFLLPCHIYRFCQRTIQTTPNL